ncbi:MAG TPA: ABC transporter permease [Bryobacteraceae bacterium]|nr:ABC transporter permease [Bryobacteraceae bacterium]
MLKRLQLLWRALTGRSTLERDMDDELRFHLETRAADLVRAGVSAAEAARRARIEFGALEGYKERCREARGLRPFDEMRGDLRYALRVLRKSPVFAIASIVTLALGIGAGTAIFSAVKAVLLNQLPYREPVRLVALGESDAGEKRPETVGYTTAYDWRRLSHSFAGMSLYRDAGGALVERGEAELLTGLRVNHDFFDTLGIRMQIGRSFLPEEDRNDHRYEVILAHGLWLRRFGGDPGIIGRVIRLSDSSFTVVGVLPESFRSLNIPGAPGTHEIFEPLGYALADPWACRDCQHLHLIARLKPGVAPERAHAELNTIMADLVRQYPRYYPPQAAVAFEPLHEYIVGRVSTALWVLLGAVGFVWLIACVNVANLLLARAASRAKEMALRAALGAARWRLIRQLLAESLLLAIAGGVAGVLLAWWSTAALTSLAPREVPRIHEIRMDVPVLLFALAVSLATALLFGLLPAWRASHSDPAGALQDLGKATAGRARRGLRDVLVMGELALAFVLAVGAGLLGKSFLRLMNVDPGFDPRNVLTLKAYVYGARYQKPEAELQYDAQAFARLRATPGIESVAMTSALPLRDFDRYGFHIRDHRLAHDSEAPSVDNYSVSPDYFRVMRIPLKRGRQFTDADGPAAPRVAIIGETCARQEFPNQDPIGKQIQLGGRDETKPWITIVGVAGDVRQYGMDIAPRIAAYIPQAQNMGFSFSLVARTTTDPRALERAARAAFLAADPTLPVYQVQPLESYLASSLAERRFTLALLGLFGGLALALAAVGIYGVVSCAVTSRTREMGIRMALGAARRDVLAMVLRQAATLAFVGLAAGLAASLALTRFLETLLFEVRATDLATLAGIAALLSAVALAASYIPARRAAGVDPTTALRYE